MDGRKFRKWCVLGCLLAALGCNRGAKQQNLIGPMPDSGTKLVNMPVGKSSKSFWGSGGSNTPTMPVEMVPEAAMSKKPPAVETFVATTYPPLSLDGLGLYQLNQNTLMNQLSQATLYRAAFSKRLPLERLFRDARAGWVMAPTADHLREFVGRALTGLPLF